MDPVVSYVYQRYYLRVSENNKYSRKLKDIFSIFAGKRAV
jgi:hypothetical protein